MGKTMYEVTAARGELKKMQKRRKPPRRRTGVRQRRFSAVEKAKTLFRLLKESARIPTSFRKSDYTKAIIKCSVFAFSVCAFLDSPRRSEPFDQVGRFVCRSPRIMPHIRKNLQRSITAPMIYHIHHFLRARGQHRIILTAVER